MDTNKIFTNEKCIGCNRCTLNCPCVEANVAHKKDGVKKVDVDESKCIKCGKCLSVCTHDARDYTDTPAVFFLISRAGKISRLLLRPQSAAMCQNGRV